MSPAVPQSLVRETMIEAALGDAHGDPVFDAGELFAIAHYEILLLVAEIDTPSPDRAASRRATAIRIAAEMSRTWKAFEGGAL